MNVMTPTRPSLPSNWNTRPADQTFASLTDLYHFTRMLHDESKANNHEVGDIEVVTADPEKITDPDDLGKLGLRFRGMEDAALIPSHYVFQQLCSLVKAPAGFLRELPGPIAAGPLQYKVATYPRELVKVYYMPDHQYLRAITSPTYGRIADYKLVDSVRQIAGNGNGDTNWVGAQMIAHMDRNHRAGVVGEPQFYASDRDMFMFLVDRDHPITVGGGTTGHPQRTLYRGFFAYNSEVGGRSLGIKTFLFNSWCENRAVFGSQQVEEIVIRHTRNAPERFLEAAAPALQEYARASSAEVENGINTAMLRLAAKTDDEAANFLNGKTSLSMAAARKALALHQQEEGHPARSAWDMVQACTAWARSIPHQGDRVALETEAGKLLAA